MSSQNQPTAIDLAIFGGGVAGLWLLARARQAGFRAVLFESDRLGAGQTRYAQGIIHGGVKYALTGKLTGSSEAIAEMPAIWRRCLAGDGEVDLREVRQLSSHQYMWATESLGSRMAGFFASRLMRSRTRAVEGDERPEVFRNAAFKGRVYRLEEPVLDTASLVRVLAEPHREAICKLPPEFDLRPVREKQRWQIKGEAPLNFEASRLVFLAGRGNAAMLERCGFAAPAMQLRPLKMVALRGSKHHPLPGKLYAHCLGPSANPRITITTHYDREGRTVWYLGGQVAEEGVQRDHWSQVTAARQELTELFPWLDLSGAEWGTLPIERAEPRMPDGGRPDNVFAEEHDGIITGWPTKLALAPRLAAVILDKLRQGGLEPESTAPLPDLPQPAYAPLPWEEDVWS